MFAISEIWSAVRHLVLAADPIALILAFVAAVVAGLTLRRLHDLAFAVAAALAGFALLCYLYVVAATGAKMGAAARASVTAFLDMRMAVLIAYVLLFAILIGVVYALRRALKR
jgi:hypothetical protein